MNSFGHSMAGVVIASCAAGPMFVWFTACARVYSQLPSALAIGFGDIAALVGFSLFSAPFGFILSIVPNLIGGFAMAWLADGSAWARSALMWGIAGGGFAMALVLLFGSGYPDAGPINFGLIATGVSCALICRRFTRWSPD